MTTLKLQYDNYETGEFTEDKYVDKKTLLTIFDQNTEIVPFHKTYTIKQPLIKFYIKTKENYLCVMHFTKDAFTVWYCNDADKQLFEGNFYKKNVRKILELFIDNKFDELNILIPRSKNSEKSLIKSFATSDFLYTFKKRGVHFLILFSVILLPLHYFFLSSIFIRYDLFLAIISSMFPIANFFLIRLHFNYIKHSKDTSIKISSGSPIVTVYNDRGTFEFAKYEVKILLQYFGAGYRNPYAEYSFSRIVLYDNRTFDISYMLIEPSELKFKLSKVTTKRIYKFYPYIKNYST
jgi:hypothetical protein